MKKLTSVEQYIDLAKKARIECLNVFSNNYFMPADVQRYIEVGQAYYEKAGNGYILLLDEEKYFRVCLYVDAEQSFVIPQLNKKAVIKNVYRKGREEPCKQQIERNLEELGFEKRGTDVQIKGEVKVLYEKSKHLERYASKMEEKGFRCVMAKEEDYQRLENLVLGTKIIKDYQIDYRTAEEKKLLKDGLYLCIFKADQLCAASVCFCESDVAYGEGIAIAEKYKMHGLAPILAYHRYKWLYENSVKYMQGWILLGNEASMRYHTSSGYQFVNKYVDEWIKE